MISLTNELNQYAKTENRDSIIITGDINFDNTIWQTLISNDGDNIGNLVLKNLPALSKSLLIVFKAAVSKGYFPSFWKISEVIPVFRDKDRADVKQYRPISLLCNTSKIFEKVIFNELYDIIQTTLHNAQLGFRRHGSVVTQRLLFLNHLYNKFDGNEEEVLVLYLDFKKAFVSVPHDILLQKMEMLRIGGNFMKIIASFLNKRKQYVKLNDFNSETVQVTTGVPQGSLLGPLLFIIFVNDLPLQVTKCEAFGYADDFKLVATNSGNMQYDIKQIEEWCLNNKMTLNENKCYILPIKSQDKPKLSLNNKTLLYQSEQKDRGFTMAPKLNWKPNVRKKVLKGTESVLLLKKKHFNVHKLSAKLYAYAGYVVPIVTHATQAWFANKTETKKIERAQFTSSLIIYRTTRSTSLNCFSLRKLQYQFSDQ